MPAVAARPLAVEAQLGPGSGPRAERGIGRDVDERVGGGGRVARRVEGAAGVVDDLERAARRGPDHRHAGR